MVRGAVLVVAFALASAFPALLGAAVTTYDSQGTVLVDGVKTFPIALSKGPPLDGTTPSGTGALDEVIQAGVNFLKVGPATTSWNDAEIADAEQWDAAAAARGAYTWINLSTLSRAQPGSPQDALLQRVITTLKGDPGGGAGIGMWKGADEPWWSGIPVSSLQFAYCLATSRGDSDWCSSEPPVDSDHLWVTVEAPRGTASDLAPYSAVTDTHGVDIYPVGIRIPDPDLHQVGVWTDTIASITPNHSVWTTLEICASGSYDSNGNYVLPTRTQERYMIYDAIVNGARNLNFYGGNNFHCWNDTDNAYGWSWTFWDTVLKGLVQEIGAGSPLAPALVDPASNQVLASSDPTTEAISRLGSSSDDLWVIAARSGSGTQDVTISGLPSSITSGTVYTENRSIAVANGSFTDSFSRWGVHVYRFSTAPAPPTITSFRPASGITGTRVTIDGTNLGGTTAVTFDGKKARFSVVSPTRIRATVPDGASTGPIAVTTGAGTATSSSDFVVTLSIVGVSPRRGPVGASVTLTGVGFTDVQTVSFNGVPAAFTVQSDSKIVATVPSGATTGAVTAKSPLGTVKGPRFTVVTG
jgi:hypothetical protein